VVYVVEFVGGELAAKAAREGFDYLVGRLIVRPQARQFRVLEEVEAIVGEVAGEVTAEALHMVNQFGNVRGACLVQRHRDDAGLALQLVEAGDGFVEVTGDAADRIIGLPDGVQGDGYMGDGRGVDLISEALNSSPLV